MEVRRDQLVPVRHVSLFASYSTALLEFEFGTFLLGEVVCEEVVAICFYRLEDSAVQARVVHLWMERDLVSIYTRGRCVELTSSSRSPGRFQNLNRSYTYVFAQMSTSGKISKATSSRGMG